MVMFLVKILKSLLLMFTEILDIIIRIKIRFVEEPCLHKKMEIFQVDNIKFKSKT